MQIGTYLLLPSGFWMNLADNTSPYTTVDGITFTGAAN